MEKIIIMLVAVMGGVNLLMAEGALNQLQNGSGGPVTAIPVPAPVIDGTQESDEATDVDPGGTQAQTAKKELIEVKVTNQTHDAWFEIINPKKQLMLVGEPVEFILDINHPSRMMILVTPLEIMKDTYLLKIAYSGSVKCDLRPSEQIFRIGIFKGEATIAVFCVNRAEKLKFRFLRK